MAKGTLTSSGAIDFTVARGRLLMIAGEKDHIIPAALNYKNFEAYRDTPAQSDFLMLADRDHWLIAGAGWEEVAGATLQWVRERQAR